MSKQPNIQDRRRTVVVAVGLFFLLSALVVQFYRLQIVEATRWETIAQNQHAGRVQIPFRRGTFFGTTMRTGESPTTVPLALDVPKFHLHVDPAAFPTEVREAVAENISLLIECPFGDVLNHLNKRSRNRQIVRWLNRKQHEEILEWWYRYARAHKLARNGLFFVKDYQRTYPHGCLLGQVLHTIRDHKDEKTKQGLPTGGLEAYFHDLLTGKPGVRQTMRSPRHRLALQEEVAPPTDGADIILTIDPIVQAIAEEELKKGVEWVQAKGGWAIVMQPNTGAILALAQYPFFSPQRYRDYFNEPEKIPDTVVKAVTYAYEPGSVIKAVTMTLCLLANEELSSLGEPPLFDPEEPIDTLDGQVPGRRRPLKDTRLHRQLNMNMGIQKSSNIYVGKMAARLIERMGTDWYVDKLTNLLQLGQPTGVELPGETCGFIPRPGRLYRNGATQWSAATPYSLAMGYNLLVNSMQMARIYALLANRGMLVQPTLVRQVVRRGPNGDHKILFDLDTHLIHAPPKQVIAPKIIEQIVTAMGYVTQEGGGAPLADIPGFSEAGKSGTAEKLIDGQYHKQVHFSSFIGFTPATKPELVILVAVDEPIKRFIPGYGTTHFGGKCAAPIFRKIGQRSLAYLGVTPDDPHGHPPGDPRRNLTLSDQHSAAVQLREIYQSWNTIE